MAERDVYYAVPEKVTASQILKRLQDMGYGYATEGVRRGSLVYYDTQDGVLFGDSYRLRQCRWRMGGGAASGESHTAPPSIEESEDDVRSWQLLRGGALFLSQPDRDGKIPGNGVIADRLSTLCGMDRLHPCLESRVSEQLLAIFPPRPTVDGHPGSDAGAAPNPRLRLESWSFKSPFRDDRSAAGMYVGVDRGENEAEGDYLEALLRDHVELLPVDFEPLRSGLEAIGLALPGTPVPPRYRLTTGDSVFTAIGKILGQQAYKMRGNMEGTIQDLDPEFLHDLRVATRRARFALKLFKKILGEERASVLRRELSWVARSLGKVRDIDVFRETFTEQFKKIGAGDKVIRDIFGYYGGRRHRYLEQVRESLLSTRYEKLLEALTGLEEEVLAAGEQGGGRIVSLVPKLVGKVLDGMEEWLKRSGESLTAEDLHALRIEFKGLRYTTEFFNDLYAPGMGAVIRQFVRFQDCLGLHQDAQVAMDTLRGLSERATRNRAASVEKLLGIGSLIQVQRDIQERQRIEFLGMWGQFPARVKELRKLLKSGKFYRQPF
jgi:CHAD domain-containing protein